MTITKGEGKTVVYTVPNDIVVSRSVVRSVGKSTKNEYVYNGYITDVESLNAFLAKASVSTADAPVKGVILNDLDLSGATVTAATVLYGELDGRKHSIKNWKNNAGTLIAENNGTVKDLIIDESCTLTAPSELVAADFGVLITKQGDVGKCIGCKNYADISVAPTSMSTTWRFAPLIGHNDQGYLEGCENHGDVTVTLNNAQTHNIVMGGVVGYCKGDVIAGQEVATNCKNFGNVVLDAKNTVKANSVGGVFGATPVHAASEFKNTGVFSGCVNSGNVTYTIGVNDDASYTNVGGVIGYCEGDMESCSNSGAITHRNSTAQEVACVRPSVGGVAGCVGYSMKNCKNTGLVEFSGYSKHGSLENFAGGCIRPAFGGVVGSIGSSAAVAGSVLQNCDNGGELKVVNRMVAGTDKIEPMAGGIAGYACVAISDCDNLKDEDDNGKMTVQSSAFYNCVGGVVGRIWGSNTMTNCSNAAALSLEIFGNGTNQAGNAVAGGVVGRAQVETNNCRNSGALNLTVSEGSNSPAINFGGIVGHTRGSVTNYCTNAGTLTLDVLSGTGTIYVGGVVGLVHDDATDGLLSGNCSNTGALTLNNPTGAIYAGGVVGYTKFKIENVVNGGALTVNFSTSGTTGFNYIGGIAGRGKGGIENCTNSGNLSVTNKKVRLGGLAGFSDGTIIDCNVLESILTVNGTSDKSQIGGFSGYSNNNISGGVFSGSIVNNSTNATYTGGLVGGLAATAGPTITDVSMSVSITSNAANSGLIYGGQAEGDATNKTITMGTEAKPIKILSGSTFLGSNVTESTTLIGTTISTDAAGPTLNSNIEFIDSLPIDSGSTTSAFQPASNWTGTWN